MKYLFMLLLVLFMAMIQLPNSWYSYIGIVYFYFLGTSMLLALVFGMKYVRDSTVDYTMILFRIIDVLCIWIMLEAGNTLTAMYYSICILIAVVVVVLFSKKELI